MMLTGGALSCRGPAAILALLHEREVPYELIRHGPVYTCAQAARARNVPLRNELKTLLVVYNNAFAMLSVPGNRRISRRRVRSALSAHAFRFADSSEMQNFHLSIGTISPLSISGCRSLLDQEVLSLDWITTNAGTLTLGLRINVEQLLKVCTFEVFRIVEGGS
jgi:prolyl-tRNA editing enzyme YbaK/EbsC (Cys-tRNA(Pro) deacylase)